MDQKSMFSCCVLIEIFPTMNKFVAKYSNETATRPAKLVCLAYRPWLEALVMR